MMSDDLTKMPFSERMRPQQPDDLILPEPAISAFKRMIETGLTMNMIFSGPPGLGKTSAVRIITAGIGADALTVTGSALSADIREQMLDFISGMPFGGPKVCVIEEAEFLPKATQASLRTIIEGHPLCRFLLTTNDIESIDAAVLDRLTEIEFSVDRADKGKAARRLLHRYGEVLTHMGVAYDAAHLQDIIVTGFPRFRAIANRVEFEILLGAQSEH